MSAQELLRPLPFANAGEQLAAELALLDLRLHRQVLRLRGAHLLSEDQFRGLYIADEQADALLRHARHGEDASAAELTRRIAMERAELQARAAESMDAPLARVERQHGRFAAELLVLAIAPELDLRYRTLYAYAQNDVTRKSPTVDLALQLLCDGEEERLARRGELRPDAPLFRDRLLRLVDDPHDVAPPLLARYVRTDARVADHLRGDDALDAALVRIARIVRSDQPAARRLPHACVFIEGPESSGRTACAASMAGSLLVVDGPRLTAELVPLVRREALLGNHAVAIRSFDELQGAIRDALAAELLDLDRPLFLLGRRACQPERAWLDAAWLTITMPQPTFAERQAAWRDALDASDDDIGDAAAKFVLTPGQIRRAARTAAARAALRDSAVTAADLAAGAHAQATHRLRTLAERVESRYEWDDLVLPPRAIRQLREICRAMRFRHVVFGEWGFDRRVPGKGLVALFSGPSGTGKTMAASIVARHLGLELYRIDLSSVVSKYIGETEKNLSEIFDEARASNAILFFDEADALFGKRSEVKDAHDRYANIETAYLLQRVESHDGCVILATNLAANMDEAFSRRIHHALEFPLPDPRGRERIWRGMLPAAAPLAADVDLAFLARQFDLTGGNIRNIALAAAFAAAATTRPITMADLVEATARELQKLGRLPSRVEFGEWYGRVEGGA